MLTCQLQDMYLSFNEKFFLQGNSMKKIWQGALMKGLFGRAPAPPKMASALASLLERLYWWSWNRFEKYLAKRLLHSCFSPKWKPSMKLVKPRFCGFTTPMEAENGLMASFTTKVGPKKPVWKGFSWSRSWSCFWSPPKHARKGWMNPKSQPNLKYFLYISSYNSSLRMGLKKSKLEIRSYGLYLKIGLMYLYFNVIFCCYFSCFLTTDMNMEWLNS